MVNVRFQATRSPSEAQAFDEVRHDVQRRADLAFPDRVLPLSRLRMTELGTIDVPGVGQLAPTRWSRGQLARMLGIRWDRWFDDTLVSPQERADEVNRRLQRNTGDWKVRARRYGPGDVGFGDGVLRAFVGPRYTSIDDVRVFDRFAQVLGSRADAFRFVRVDLTDRSSQYVALSGEDINLGNGKPDPHKNGILIVNSEVGASALKILEYLFRLVCTNGLVVAVNGQRLFFRVHRKTSDDSIDRDLAYSLALLPERWAHASRALSDARQETVDDPELWIRHLLAADPIVRPHTEAALAAYQQEPEPNRFGIAQAIARAAQTLAPEDRLLMEHFAGRVGLGEAARA
jgi:uncharacterized protein DUF932